MRYLGIDYGKKRIGVAVADGEIRIATPRGVIARQNDAQAAGEIASMVKEEKIEKIIMGLPFGLDGQENEMSRAARAFGQNLSVAANAPIEFENEMLTTRMAMHEGMNKEAVDAASAAIILQSYLDKTQMPKSK